MGKNNAFLARVRAEKEAEKSAARIFAIQQCKDVLLIAAHDEFGFGPERIKRLSDVFDKTMMEYAELVVKDSKDDKSLAYCKDKIDRALREACGEYFVPWEERYGL